jgi:pimeloyl-ACP methyl ester carboxylesterase
VTRAVLCVAALSLLGFPSASSARLRWRGCGDVEAACTRVAVPLDRTGAVPGSVRLRMARFSTPRGKPTLLYLSGGPGSAGVREFAGVAFELGGLEHDYRLVSFDQRGTGSSGLLRCPALERDPRVRSTSAGEACAESLGARRAFYGTRDSVEDIEALRRALGVDKLTLFGISYGTKLALAYARAHPDHVARIALDSVADPDEDDSLGLEPYRAMAGTLKALCPGRCVSADPAADLAQLVARLRRAPMSGLVYRLRRGPRRATLSGLGLSDLMFDSDYNPAVRAGIPAAVRAALDHGDPAPLLRLEHSAAGLSTLPGPRSFSAGRYAAVCEEVSLPWPRSTPFGERKGLARAEADRAGPEAFFPFGFAEAWADEIDLCLHWAYASPPPVLGGAYPAVPALILQGGEDLRTPPAVSARVAARLPGAVRVVVPGVGHAVVGGDPSGCGVRRLLAFLHGRPASVPCRRVATLVPAEGVLPRTLGQVAPTRGVPGRAGRTVAALDATFDDLTFALSPALGSPLAGPGLRGGSFRLRRGGIVLYRLQVVRGVRVSGVLPARGSASLRLSGSAAAAGRLRVSSRGAVRGRLGGKRVGGRLRAGPPRPVAGGARAATAGPSRFARGR